jgi:hypothetical protein
MTRPARAEVGPALALAHDFETGWRSTVETYLEARTERRHVVNRGISIVLAVGLVILWLVGLNRHATPWLTWLDVVAALCAFAIAAGIAGRTRGADVGAPVVLAIGLFVLWIIGLSTHASMWLVWWTFAFACAFLFVGVGAGAQRPQITQPRTV